VRVRRLRLPTQQSRRAIRSSREIHHNTADWKSIISPPTLSNSILIRIQVQNIRFVLQIVRSGAVTPGPQSVPTLLPHRWVDLLYEAYCKLLAQALWTSHHTRPSSSGIGAPRNTNNGL
jgi:hypothetical protein